MTELLPSRFPEPLADDDDDVAWALQTAKVQWQRGAQPEAIVWLGRAADSADQLGSIWRAAELRRLTAEFMASFGDAPRSSKPPLSRGTNEVDDLLEAPPDRESEAERLSYVSVTEIDAEVEPHPTSMPEITVQELAARAELVTIDEFDDDDEEVDSEEAEEADVISEDPARDAEASLPAFPAAKSRETSESAHADASEIEDPVTQPRARVPKLARHASTRPGPAFVDPAPVPEEEPRLKDVVLGQVRGLEDLPQGGQALLVRAAVVEKLGLGEEVSSFGLALVLNGSVDVMPTIADLSCARSVKGDIVWQQGHLDEGVALRLVAAEDDSEVAVWETGLIQDTLRDCPWVIDDLKGLADRYQALAGVAMGPLGERLDDELRSAVTGRCEVKRLGPNEQLLARGKPVGGMYIVAAGRIEVRDETSVDSELGPGDFLFGPQVLSNSAAPHDARAGKRGALLLFAPRSTAHDLLLSVPPLLEIFAS